MKTLDGKGFALPSFLKKSLGGFTLIELLIVIALIVVLGAVGFTSLVDKNQRDEFDLTLKRMVTILNQARDRSATQDSLDAKDAADWWGVYFYKGTETTWAGIEVCKTASYGAPDGIPSFNLAKFEDAVEII